MGVHHGSAGAVFLIIRFVGDQGFVETAGSGQALLLCHGAVDKAAARIFCAGKIQDGDGFFAF